MRHIKSGSLHYEIPLGREISAPGWFGCLWNFNQPTRSWSIYKALTCLQLCQTLLTPSSTLYIPTRNLDQEKLT